MSLCIGCYSARNIIKKGLCVPGKIPAFSIAAGFDYGCLDRAKLPKLSYIENILIARNITHLNMFKLKLKNQNSSVLNQTGMTGHTIAFPNNSVDRLNRVWKLPRSSVADVITISFFGTAAVYNQAKICIKSMKQFSVSRSKLRTWLCFLKAIGNPYYQDVELWDHGMSDSDYERAIVNELINSVRLVDDNDSIMAEELVTAALNGIFNQN